MDDTATTAAQDPEERLAEIANRMHDARAEVLRRLENKEHADNELASALGKLNELQHELTDVVQAVANVQPADTMLCDMDVTINQRNASTPQLTGTRSRES